MLAGLSVDYVVHDLTGFSQPALFAAASEAIVVGMKAMSKTSMPISSPPGILVSSRYSPGECRVRACWSVGYATSTILAMVLGIVCVSFVLLEGGGARAFDPWIPPRPQRPGPAPWARRAAGDDAGRRGTA
jgi:NCS1 family nucleobase:cation symporter-1